VWTTRHRRLTVLVHPSLKRQQVVQPFDGKKAFGEGELVSRCAVHRPVNLFELRGGPAITASEGGKLGGTAHNLSDHAWELAGDSDAVHGKSDLAGRKEGNCRRCRRREKRSGRHAIAFYIEDSLAREWFLGAVGVVAGGGVLVLVAFDVYVGEGEGKQAEGVQYLHFYVNVRS
jgi:hypothetical protein